MGSVSERLTGMELDEAKALLLNEEVTFTVGYTKADREMVRKPECEGKHRVVRVKEKKGELELTICVI